MDRATREEQRASGDTRKGKLYVYSITCPVHPTKAAEAKAKAAEQAAARKKKAQEATQRKAEKERKEREERARLAAIQRAKVRDAYDSLVGSEEDAKGKQTSPKPSGTLDAFVKVDVTSAALLSHAGTIHIKRSSDIRVSISKERDDLMAELRKKQAKEMSELRHKMEEKQSILLKEADEEYATIKAKINRACGEKTPRKGASANFITPCDKRG